MTHSQVGSDQEQRLAEVVDEFFDAVADGETPEISDYLRRYPEIAGQLKIVIPAMLATERAATRSEPTSLQDATPRQLGDFRILRQIGRGGMGIVYEAEQILLQRRVALKILPLAGLVDKLKIRRFQNEVRAVAALDHPNIVPVYMVGEERGVHYYAMQLIRGRSLSDVIASLRRVRNEGAPFDGESISQVAGRRQSEASAAAGSEIAVEPTYVDAVGQPRSQPPETVVAANSSTIPHSSQREYYRSVTALGIQAASALQHAHDGGVVHRDIKPANLLLDDSAKLFITDFGLARIESDVGVTMTGDLLGTLRYMAPEQALGKRVVVDHRADIYSLGVTLYELLALQPAFQSESRPELLKQIAFEEPTKLRRVDHNIPKDLETIVHKAMSKEMDQRYQSSQELADDLRSHLENRPISARPPTTTEIISKWTRRNPVLTWSAMITLTLVAMTLAASTLVISKERDLAEVRRVRAEVAEQESTSRANELARNIYLLHLASADSALLKQDYSQARTELDACPQEHRGWEWRFLVGRLRAAIPQAFLGAEQPIFTRDGKRLMAIGAIGTPEQRLALAWDVATGERAGAFNHEWRLSHIALSPDEERIAGGDHKGNIFVWDAATGKELWSVAEHTAKCDGLAFSPDGILIASANDDKTVKVFDAKSGAVRFTIASNEAAFRKVMFSPDGRWIAAGLLRGQGAMIIDVTKKEIVARFPGAGHMIPTFDPTGRRIATSNLDGSISLWDWDGEQLTVLQSWEAFGDGYVWALDFSPDGDRLVSGSIGKGVKVWDSATGRQLATLDTKVGALWLAHNPRRSQVAYFTIMNGIQLWNYDQHEEGLTVTAVDGPAVASFSPDGQRIVASIARAGLWVSNIRRTATNQGSHILMLDAASGTDILEIGEDLHSASWTADGRNIVAASDPQREIRMYSASTGEQTRVFKADTSLSAGFALSGRGLDLISVDGAIHTWDRRAGDEAVVWTTGSDKRRLDVIGLGMSPHNARVAVVFYSELRAEIWDVRTRSKINSVLVSGPTVGQIAFSKDGNSLYVGSPGGRLVEIDIDSGRETKRFNGHTGSVTAIALSPAEDQLVSGGDSGRVIVWDVASEQPLVTLADAGQPVVSLDWSSDGRRIVAGKGDGTVQIWTLPDSP